MASGGARPRGPIDLLVTDVVMPGLSGRDTAERLAAQRPGLRVLFISGYTDDAILARGLLQAKLDLLEKPFTPAALARKASEVLGRRADLPATPGAAPPAPP